jgi:2-polyprenyl-3-methyl-5-hydroxy-6-metoxy-1,4-benzoquinol methylase
MGEFAVEYLMARATDQTCPICGAQEWAEAYAGPIRDGVFGRECNGVVTRCGRCTVEILVEPRRDLAQDYADGTYRTHVGEGSDARSFFALHDREQFARIEMLERVPLRGSVVADVGCGGGSFLDAVAGLAATTIGIEPSQSYHASLSERRHQVYPNIRAALGEWAGKVDLAVSFSVIEHVDDPVALLADVRSLLTPSGVAFISTPNRGDVLLAAGCEAYRRFFYRVVHRFYFDATSLREAAAAARFGSCEVVYRHRFGFANFVNWLSQQRPDAGRGRSPLDRQFDRMWITTLEEGGHADYLYAYLRQ